jgi:hypothetical protein
MAEGADIFIGQEVMQDGNILVYLGTCYLANIGTWFRFWHANCMFTIDNVDTCTHVLMCCSFTHQTVQFYIFECSYRCLNYRHISLKLQLKLPKATAQGTHQKWS